MSFFIFTGIFVNLFLFVMIKGNIDENRKKKAYKKYLEQKYGAYPVIACHTDDLKRVAKRFEYKKAAIDSQQFFLLDEITWNDLEMDKLYEKMNVTQSAAGAEYLYSMLHMPCLQAERLEELERHISFFDSHATKRVAVQEICHELGNMGKYSIYDYIIYLSGAKSESKGKHLFMCLLLLMSLGLICWKPTTGIFCFIVSACVNVLSYMNVRRQILPYLTGISYIRRLLLAADMLVKCADEDLPGEIRQLFLNLQEDILQLSKFRAHACFVSGMNSGSGSPIQLITDYIRMFTHIDLIQYQLMMQELQNHKEQIIRILDTVGYVDAVIAIASYRKSCGVWSVPELSDDKCELIIEHGVHPLIKNPVANTYSGKRGMLVTGSNASGKSTFLKMLALNAVLAQTIHTVTALHYEGRFYRIYSSMALRDNLSGGDSYYMVEIKALKRIMDAVPVSKQPILCFVDEVLRGTNTVERIAASSQILQYLAENKVYCFAATHDVELTYLLEKQYDNYHFKEDVDGKDIVFSYKLLSGRANSRNAIKLLNQIGFDTGVVEQAEKLASRFLETNQWV